MKLDGKCQHCRAVLLDGRRVTCSKACQAELDREIWRTLVHLQIEALIHKHQPPPRTP